MVSLCLPHRVDGNHYRWLCLLAVLTVSSYQFEVGDNVLMAVDINSEGATTVKIMSVIKIERYTKRLCNKTQ